MGLSAWFKRIVFSKREKGKKPKETEAIKSLHFLQGTSKFQGLIKADALTKQAANALDRIHFWSKIQAEIRTRRLCMVKESRIKQKKLQNQLKLESRLHELEVEWCNGPGTMDEIVSKIQQREEAANKRERAMAYAFSHQWRAKSGVCFGQAYYDLSKESWGWSWVERWIAVCPWEARVVSRPIAATQTNKAGKKTKTVKPDQGTGKRTKSKSTTGTC